MIPQPFIQDLLARVDIVDVIERHLQLKKGGANYFARCPFHDEKSASFSVSPTKQFYHCFGCGAHGTAIGFLMEYSGLGFIEAVHELARMVGVEVPQDTRQNLASQPSSDTQQRLLDTVAVAERFYRDQLKHTPTAIDYLKRRGVTGEIAARFGIGFAPDDWQSLQRAFPDYNAPELTETGLIIENDAGRRYDRFRGRIIFPIHDRRGRVIAFGGRVLDKSEPKYLNSPETPLFEKGHELYGLFLAQKPIRDSGFALVVEGYMDVVSLAQFGLANTVATLGTATTSHHVKALLRHTDRIVFCFDGDIAGRKAAWRALESSLESLRDDATLAFLFLPEGQDPDSFVRSEGADALRDAARNAQPLAGFLIDELARDCPLDTAEGRARMVHEARPYVTRIAAPLLRLQLLKQIADHGGLSQRELESAYGLHSGEGGRPPPAAPPGRESRPRALRRPMPRHKPTSPVAGLLRLVLQHPAWIARLPVDLIPDDDTHGRALIALIDAMSVGEIDTDWGLGMLVERFRNTEHADTLSEAAAELFGTDYDEAIVETLFEDTVRKLHVDAIDREILELTRQDRESGLSPTDRRRIAELLIEKRNLSEAGKTKNL